MTDLKHVKECLYERRYTIRSWAIRHGYKPNTVDKSLRRSLARGTKPRGILARKILREMEQTLEIKLLKEAA